MAKLYLKESEISFYVDWISLSHAGGLLAMLSILKSPLEGAEGQYKQNFSRKKPYRERTNSYQQAVTC
jgi:hypothetical protein